MEARVDAGTDGYEGGGREVLEEAFGRKLVGKIRGIGGSEMTRQDTGEEGDKES